MYKNVASQKVVIFAWDGALGTPKSGDAANITAFISKDGAAEAATNDVNPTELDATNCKGIYVFDLTQAETNADLIIIYPSSTTANVVIRPVIIYTTVLQDVKAQTDKLTFTVANQVDANIQYVNDIQIIGDGEVATPWGPV